MRGPPLSQPLRLLEAEERSRLGSDRGPKNWLDIFFLPTQEGERCYFCQDPAEFFYRRLLWCHGCAKNVKGFICREPILGKNPKTIPTFHQWSQLFPWGKLVLILLTGQDGINVYAELPWTLALWILFHGKEVRMKALARKEALARMEAIFHK